MARPGIEPRTSDLRVRRPTDCATRPGNRIGTEAYCLYGSSPSCNKFVHFMVAFLSLQYKIILRRFIVIKQYLEKRVILHSKFMQRVKLI